VIAVPAVPGGSSLGSSDYTLARLRPMDAGVSGTCEVDTDGLARQSQTEGARSRTSPLIGIDL